MRSKVSTLGAGLAPHALIAAAVLLTPPHAAAQTHPFSVHDLVAMDRVSDPVPSPDGGQIAFVVRETDLEADRGRTDLWLVPTDGSSAPRRLTTHEAADSSPRFAPDGSAVYFLSTRSGSSQVWRLPLAGGEARQVTELPIDAGVFLLSPDGRTLAVTAETFPDCPTVQCSADRLAEREQAKSSGRIYDRLLVRHWDTLEDGRRSHLFVLPTAGGEPIDVTRGLDGDVPSRPFGGAEEIAFSPDSSTLVFAMRLAGWEEAWSTDFDLYSVPVDGSTPPVELTADNPAWDTHPVFSPDGKTLAYLAMERAGYESDRFRVLLRAWPEGPTRVLTGDWDRSVSELVFAPDGANLLVTAGELGRRPLFAVDVGSGAVRELVPGGTVRSPVTAGRRIVFGMDHLHSPVELDSVDLEGGDRRRLTDLNGERLAAIRMGEPEQFSFAGWSDETVYGYVVKPADFDPGRTYPVAFLIHGGPQGSFGDDFHYRWNPQVYAGAGYAAVMIDFHGSTGYGQAFTDSIRDDWGGKPLEDLKRGLAAALERYSFLDGERVCALGASYGGYMINWIAGQWPERFRCLVNHDGLFDNRSMYYSTEELWFPEWDHRGPYFENPEGHEKHNPVRFVDRWRTPMLVIHGALDYRVPETQGLATFGALQRRGVPSRLLYFPDENHFVLRPSNSIQWHEEVLGWLERFLR
jgi:dipeptidyl aminopeptidase/acylaminoacyl peptidase